MEVFGSKKNRKGFYVRMKLLRIKRGKAEYLFSFRYFKWILWVSLSFYFFATSLGNHRPATTSLETQLGSVSSVLSAAAVSLQPRSSMQLRLYIYELPSKYNSDWLSNERCANHLFASEVAIHKALLNSHVRTFDPSVANFFFLPVYVSCNFSTVNGFPSMLHARRLLSSAVELISSELPFWNRNNGSDHIFVASHDYGACFHAMEGRAVADGIPEFMKNSIVLQTFGVKYRHPCQDVENIVIPPYVSPEKVQSIWSTLPVSSRRDIFVFFRGKMEVHPKNVSGQFYSKRVRTQILRKYGSDRSFYLRRSRLSGYMSEIVRSVFCLCPLGWAPWSPRLVESVALGCVPVIIADGIRLPFGNAVPWSEISLTVAEKDVGKLDRILEHVAATNLSSIQRNLWDPQVRRALLFNDDMADGDATWQILIALSEKVARSDHRSMLSH